MTTSSTSAPQRSRSRSPSGQADNPRRTNAPAAATPPSHLFLRNPAVPPYQSLPVAPLLGVTPFAAGGWQLNAAHYTAATAGYTQDQRNADGNLILTELAEQAIRTYENKIDPMDNNPIITEENIKGAINTLGYITSQSAEARYIRDKLNAWGAVAKRIDSNNYIVIGRLSLCKATNNSRGYVACLNHATGQAVPVERPSLTNAILNSKSAADLFTKVFPQQ